MEVKKPNQMGNRCQLFILSALVLVGFVACQNTNDYQGNKEAIVANSKKEFTPDTTVNKKLLLKNEESAMRFYPAIDKVPVINFIRESPILCFVNKAKTEYLLAYQYEGANKNSFDLFELGYYKDLRISEKPIVLNEEIFSTESDIRVGMNLGNLTTLKGDNYLKKGDTVVTYQMQGYIKSDFLKRYSMPAYYLECKLKDSKVVKIKFGFVQP